MAYLLDSNVFITAKDHYYGFDICPGFWEWLLEKHEAGVVLSVEKVREELTVGNDELADWAMQRGSAFFPAPSLEDEPSLEAVAQWTKRQAYKDAAVDKFLLKADYYLVGQAHASGHKVVTLEDKSRSRQNVKIPDVCAGMDVPCMDTFDMLRMERARFVLGRAP